MSTVLFANRVYEMQVQAKAQGQRILNILHYYLSTTSVIPGAEHTLEAFTEAFANRWRQAVIPIVCADYHVEIYLGFEYLRTELGGTPPATGTVLVTGEQFPFTGGIEDLGSLVGTALPTHNAVGYRKATGMRGRRKKGQIRIAPLPEELVDKNILDAAGVNTYFDTVLDPLKLISVGTTTFIQMQEVVFSKREALTQPPGSDLRTMCTPVLTHVLNHFVTSQVSRKQRQAVG